MKNYLKQILFGLILAFLTGLFFTQVNIAQASFPSSGYFTNLNGGGSNLNGVATYNGSYCNPGYGPSNGLGIGECKTTTSNNPPAAANIQEYVCNGKFINCDNTNASGHVVSSYPQYSTDFWIQGNSYSSQCGYTIQLDVTNNSSVAIDWMTWYSGDCGAPTATPTPTLITVCNGQLTWDSIDSQLHGANYPGPYDHNQTEKDAYNRAACPPATATPTPKPTTTPTPTGVPSLTPTPTTQITPTPTTAPVVTPTPGSDTTFQCPTADGGTVNITVSNSSAANFNCNSVIVNVTNTSSSTSSATGGSVTIEATPTISEVKELPKTGLPIEAWGLSGMLPIGFGLKKFVGDKNISKVANSATYIWQQREFLKK